MINPDKSVTAMDMLLNRLKELTNNKYFQCIQCGTCGGSCPYGAYTPYTPRRMILAIRLGMVEDILNSNAQWLCTACQTCTSRCPSRIQITDGIIPALREKSLLEGKVPEELSTALINIMRYGNPFKESPMKRDGWAKELDFEVPTMMKKKSAEVLLLPECFGAYHRRCKQATKALAKVMKILEVDFAILGREERCTGDHVRLCGEFALFEDLMEKNMKVFRKYEFKYIVTHDAHAFNALKNFYGLNVLHHSQFLHDNLEKLKGMFNELDYTVTYHDSCYLGRKNGIYEEPREVIRSIPGVRFVEFKRNRENALCCGAGGGGIWLDSVMREFVKVRPAEDRVREAKEVGADVIVTGCVLDIPMFEDALKVTGLDGEIVVKDIAELVLEALEGG